MQEIFRELKENEKPKVRHYVCTFWNEPKGLMDGVRYAIHGKEICPDTGRVHWQSYIELHNSQRPSFIKKTYEDNTIAHYIRRGTRIQARDYCKKDGNYVEYGKWISGQGHRTDLDTIAAQLVNGETTIEDVMQNSPTTYCKYRNGLKDLAGLGMKKKTRAFRKVKVIVISGSTDKGKTREAMKHAQFKVEGDTMKWWDGYEGEEVICIDEYDNDVRITKLLNVLDGYQLRLPIKGSFTYANWNTVYITTNLKKEQLHRNAKKAHREALFRRIDEWRDLGFDDDDDDDVGTEYTQGNISLGDLRERDK